MGLRDVFHRMVIEFHATLYLLESPSNYFYIVLEVLLKGDTLVDAVTHFFQKLRDCHPVRLIRVLLAGRRIEGDAAQQLRLLGHNCCLDGVDLPFHRTEHLYNPLKSIKCTLLCSIHPQSSVNRYPCQQWYETPQGW